MSCNYSQAAFTAYKNMESCFKDSTCSDYWKLGNAFDSITDFLRWWGGKDRVVDEFTAAGYSLATADDIEAAGLSLQ